MTVNLFWSSFETINSEMCVNISHCDICLFIISIPLEICVGIVDDLFCAPWKERKAAKRDLIRRTPPAPEQRKYAPSISPTTETELPVTEVRSTIGFMDLAPELRNKIYEHYMKGGTIQISRRGGRPRVANKYYGLVFREGGGLHSFTQGPCCRTGENQSIDLLPLLQTCRQVYMEAIPLLYLDRTFRFSTPSAFVSFAALIIPKRFALISRVVIDLDFTSPDEELSGLLRYQDLPDELPILNQLPLIEPGGEENYWILSCRIAKSLANLRSFKLVVKKASFLSSDYRKNYDYIFAGLNRLPLNGIDVSIDIVDEATGRAFACREKDGEIIFTDRWGDILLQEKIDGEMTRWEVFQAFQQDLQAHRDFWRI